MRNDRLTATLSALAHPARREILARLTTGPKTVTELAEPFEMTMPAVSKHLKVLEEAELIERGREAQYRPCKLRPEPLKDIDQWIDQYRKFFEGSFDRLDEYLHELQEEENNEPP